MNILLHLTLIPHVGPLTIKRLLQMCESHHCSPAVLYDMSGADIERWGFSRLQAQQIVDGLRDKTVLEKELEFIAKYRAQVIMLGDAAYPRLLREIHAPPVVLYVYGDAEALAHESMLAVVGSRQANAYGRSAVEELVRPALDHAWAVVSGGARGIDAAAHELALKQRGCTIAVLGSGLLQPYPREHKDLFRAIAEQGGAVVSPFPLMMMAAPGNFPARNRIISGMSRACLVVQAAEKSGALITAAQSLHEGRDVGVVPGSIFDPLSAGCHRLLREGATPITSAGDLKAFLGIEGNVSFVGAKAPVRDDDGDPLVVACRVAPRNFDDLLSYADGSPELLHSKLWELQIAGTIAQTITGQWEAV